MPRRAWAAAGQSWPPFVLVTGLLLLGLVASADGVFEAMAAFLARRALGPTAALLGSLALVAAVTVVLNLDTAVAFTTPVVVLAAERRGSGVAGAMYGSLLMANASSLLLPGSNLTNLLVVRDGVSGADFAGRTWPAWGAAVIVTAAIVAIWFRRDPGAAASPSPSRRVVPRSTIAALVLAAACVVVVEGAAIPVLVIGLVLTAVRLRSSTVDVRRVVEAVNVATVAGLLCLAVALGALARSWSAPGDLVGRAGAVQTAVVGAVVAVAVNNLPAAVLLSTRAPRHPEALLIGLDIGPNLAVTGSLSSLLWFKAAVSVGQRPSLRTVSTIGVVLVPVSIAAALGALALTGRA